MYKPRLPGSQLFSSTLWSGESIVRVNGVSVVWTKPQTRLAYKEYKSSGALEEEDMAHNNTKKQLSGAEREEGKPQVKSTHTRHAQLL